MSFDRTMPFEKPSPASDVSPFTLSAATLGDVRALPVPSTRGRSTDGRPSNGPPTEQHLPQFEQLAALATPESCALMGADVASCLKKLRERGYIK